MTAFTDTFDTATERDLVISRESVQGQLVERLFGGERKLLDDRLQAGLKAFTPLRTERPQDKPRGRRVRYPLGTTVPLPVDGHRVFAVAYSRLGNDLVARSAPAELRASLDTLWLMIVDSFTAHCRRQPTTAPELRIVIRLADLERTDLSALGTFLRRPR